LSDQPEADGSTEDETRDAARRTRLANERTFLAWWRTGLTALAVCVALGRIVPGVSDVNSWPYQVVGAGFGLLGLGFIVVAHARARTVERAVDRGEFARMDDRLSAGMLVAGLVLGAASILLVLFAS
jgi:putative membrane protein